MSSHRSTYRALAASTLTVALLPLLGAAPGNAADADRSAASAKRAPAMVGTAAHAGTARKKAQRASVAVLPKISQKGKRDASADRAKAVGIATFKPAKEGRKVQIERSNDGGLTWSDYGSTKKQDENGRVTFKPASPAGSGTWTYRAVAPRAQGLASMKTGTATDAWTEVFDESFSGSRLSPVWSTRGRSYDKGSLRKCSKASPKMAKVRGGVLTLKVKKDGSRRGDVCKWRKPGTAKKFKYPYFLNGHVGTEQTFSFRYGVAAARVKFQQPRGMHGSFWMNTSGENEGKRAVEIDTVEFFGKDHKDGGLAQFLHYKGRKIGGLQKSANDVLKGSDNWWKKYHVFSVEWTPSGYVFRIDGQETYRTSKARSDKQVLLILSLLSSDYELKNLPKSGKGSMQVDWVRVWQSPSLSRQNLQ